MINHIAAKIVENVATTKGQVTQKLVTTEMAQSLWYIFKHSTLDALRITALSVSISFNMVTHFTPCWSLEVRKNLNYMTTNGFYENWS